MRKVERLLGGYRLMVWVTRTETEFVFSLPAKQYPCTEAMQNSLPKACAESFTGDDPSEMPPRVS